MLKSWDCVEKCAYAQCRAVDWHWVDLDFRTERYECCPSDEIALGRKQSLKSDRNLSDTKLSSGPRIPFDTKGEVIAGHADGTTLLQDAASTSSMVWADLNSENAIALEVLR